MRVSLVTVHLFAPRRRLERAVISVCMIAAAGLYGCGGAERSAADSTTDSTLIILVDSGNTDSVGNSSDTALLNSMAREDNVSAPSAPVITPTVVTVDSGAMLSNAQFANLRWIEGKWIGLQGSGVPFFERYQWANDSTMMRYTYASQNFVSVTEMGWIILRDGHVYVGSELDSASMPVIGSASAPRKTPSRPAAASASRAAAAAPAWIATKWDSTLIAFSPLKGATNAFYWEKQPDAHWRATMVWRADEKDHQLVYEMRRSPR